MDMQKVDGDIALQEGNESNEIEDILFGTLSIEDWITIESVQSSFVSIFQFPMEGPTIDQIDLSNLTSALLSWSAHANLVALRLIDFFRQINEFQGLLLDDRLILIKYNLLSVFPICKCFQFKFGTQHFGSDYFHRGMIEHGRFFTLFNESNSIHHLFINIVLSLLQNTDGNPTLLSLLLIILILTPGLSMNEEEPPLNDPLAVSRVQCHYTKILWNYLVNQLGEIEACRRFIQLFTVILRLQSGNEIVRLFFRDQCVKANTVDKLGPLMQSVLNIS
jgi:hypothetical protein